MSNDTEILHSQMAELQSQLSFQEDAVRAMDEALASQQQEIMLLRRQIELLQQRQQEQAARQGGLGGAEGEAPSIERPPHY